MKACMRTHFYLFSRCLYLTAAYCDSRGICPEPYMTRNKNLDLSHSWLEEFWWDIAQNGLWTHRFVVEKFAKAKKKTQQPKNLKNALIIMLGREEGYCKGSFIISEKREITSRLSLIIVTIYIYAKLYIIQCRTLFYTYINIIMSQCAVQEICSWLPCYSKWVQPVWP